MTISAYDAAMSSASTAPVGEGVSAFDAAMGTGDPLLQVNPANYQQFASKSIEEQQKKHSRTLSPDEQTAIMQGYQQVAARNTMGPNVNITTPNYISTPQGAIPRNPFLENWRAQQANQNFVESAAGNFVQRAVDIDAELLAAAGRPIDFLTGTNLVGGVREQQEATRLGINPAEQGVGAFVGRTAADVAAFAGAGPAAPAMMAAQGAGSTFLDVDRMRAEGRDVGTGSEMFAATGSAVVNALAGKILAGITGTGGKAAQQSLAKGLLEGQLPAWQKALADNGASGLVAAIRESLPSLIGAETKNLAKGEADMVAMTVANNLLAKTYDPNREALGGVKEALVSGLVFPVATRGLHAAFRPEAPAGPTQAPGTPEAGPKAAAEPETPQASFEQRQAALQDGIGKLPPEQQTALVAQLAKDSETVTNAGQKPSAEDLLTHAELLLSQAVTPESQPPTGKRSLPVGGDLRQGEPAAASVPAPKTATPPAPPNQTYEAHRTLVRQRFGAESDKWTLGNDQMTTEQTRGLKALNALGVNAVLVKFPGVAKFRGVTLHQKDGSKVVLINGDLRGSGLREALAHELSHAIGLDKMTMADRAEHQRGLKEYETLLDDPQMPKEIKAQYETFTPEEKAQEGMAWLIGKAFQNGPAWRKLVGRSPGLAGLIQSAFDKFYAVSVGSDPLVDQVMNRIDQTLSVGGRVGGERVPASTPPVTTPSQTPARLPQAKAGPAMPAAKAKAQSANVATAPQPRETVTVPKSVSPLQARLFTETGEIRPGLSQNEFTEAYAQLHPDANYREIMGGAGKEGAWQRYQRGATGTAPEAPAAGATGAGGVLPPRTAQVPAAGEAGVQAAVPAPAEAPKGKAPQPGEIDSLIGRVQKAKEVVKALHEAAYSDELTGLGNKRKFDEAVSEAQQHVDAGKGPVSVIMADANNVKPGNKALTHAGVDAIFKKMAEGMVGSVRTAGGREADVVITRQGGDEFAIILKGVDAAGAEAIRQRMEKNAGVHEIIPGLSMRMIGGVAEFKKGVDPEVTLKEADRATEAHKDEIKKASGEPMDRAAAMAMVEAHLANKPPTPQQPPRPAEGAPAPGLIPGAGFPNPESTGKWRVRTAAEIAAEAAAPPTPEEAARRQRTETQIEPSEPGPRAAANLEAVFQRSLLGRLSAEDKAVLGNPEDAALRIKSAQDAGSEPDPGDVLRVIAANAGLLRGQANRIIEKFHLANDAGTREDLVQAGVDALTQDILRPMSGRAGANKGKTRIQSWNPDQGRLSTMLMGQRSRVNDAMIEAARPKGAGVKIESAVSNRPKPMPSLEKLAAAKETIPSEIAGAAQPTEEPVARVDLLARAKELMDAHASPEVIKREITKLADEMGVDPKMMFLPPEPEGKPEGERELKYGLRGEYWFQHGMAVNADLETGDIGHEGHVYDAVRQKAQEILNLSDRDMPDHADQFSKAQIAELKQGGMTEAEIKIFGFEGEPRHYGMKDLGWIHNRGNYADFYGPMSGTKMKEIARGFGDAYGEEVTDQGFDLTMHQENGRSVIFSQVPIEVLESGDPNQLARYRDVSAQFLPPGDPKTWTGKQFMDALKSALAEKPKVTGRPELANPAIREPARRAIDIIDEARKRAGVPTPKPRSQMEAEAQAFTPQQRQDVVAKLDAGKQLDANETLAAAQIVRDELGTALKSGSDQDIQAALTKVEGWRKGGTEQARAMGNRVDQTKRPGQRLSEYAIAAVSQAPKEAAKDVADMVKRWKDRGIDLENLDDVAAQHPGYKWRIIRDVQRVITKHGQWDAVQEYYRNMLMYSPLTQIRNAMGGVYAVADVAAVKPLMRLMESGSRDVSGETGAALHAMASKQAMGRALSNLWYTFRYEVPAFDTEMSRNLGWMGNEIYSTPAIKGMKGRLVRIPQDINAAVDQFVKTLHAHAEVAAEAVKMGKEKGLTAGTEEMQKFVDGEIENLKSKSWERSMAKGETARVTFQGESMPTEQLLIDLRKRHPFFGLIFPFIKTPVQIAKQAAISTPGLGTAYMATRGIEHAMGKKAYGGEEFRRHAAQQIIGLGIAAGVRALLPDDDDPWITGPSSYASSDRPERQTREQIAPPMSIRLHPKVASALGVKSGWISYRNVEPFSTMLGVTVTAVKAMRDIERGGKPSKEGMDAYHKVVGMYSDQTYLKAVGDLIKFQQDPETYGTQWLTNMATAWLPNFIDSSLRAKDEYVRERKFVPGEGETSASAFGRHLQQEVLPTGNLLPPPKVDFFGNDIKQYGDGPESRLALRLLNPFQIRQVPAGPEGDALRMLVRWNEKHPDDFKWFQAPARTVRIKTPGQMREDTEPLTEQEYHDYAQLAGRLITQKIRGEKFNTSNPTQEDIVGLETIFTKARAAALKPFEALHQARKLEDHDAESEARRAIADALREAMP